MQTQITKSGLGTAGSAQAVRRQHGPAERAGAGCESRPFHGFTRHGLVGLAVFRALIGIGGANTPTPAGDFYVRDELTRYGSATYGPLAFGTSARSTALTDWPAGGYVGIHGTDQPWLLPGRVSHGCIRMRNADILRLGRLMPVGTQITIR